MVEVPGVKTNRLSGILFNHKRYDILAYILNSTGEKVTVTDIAEGVGASRQHVTNLVNDLRDVGLVEKQKKGNLYLIEVNEASPYYLPLNQLLEIDSRPLKEAAREVVEEVIESGRYNDRIVAVYLFGSVARGTPQLDSDIDILLIHKSGGLGDEGREEIEAAFDRKGDELNVNFSLTWYTQEQWEQDRRREVAFVERVAEEGEHLAGEKL